MGTFVLSIDFEFAWGRPERLLSDNERDMVRKEVGVAQRLLSLLQELQVPATFAVVGHLLEKECSWEGSVAHPEYERPISLKDRNDWFFQHPAKGDTSDVLWFDEKGLVSSILRSPVGHEVGSHSYAHISYGDKAVSKQAVATDVEQAKAAHDALGLPFTTFVFPKNSEGYYKLLAASGIQCYRGTTRRWYHTFPGALKRAARLLDYLLPTTPPRVVPSQHESSMTNVPDSMLLLGSGGVRKLVPRSLILKKAQRGLQKAAVEGRIFHLWFHPSNFVAGEEAQFGLLRSILTEAAGLRKQRKLEVLTMGQIAQKSRA